ncbi:MAG: carboxypeptidase-like regulatory domain-containing protein, partial [bacterium]|nr:carboxypeptidase-like regulatory domain-containing protein [bacterium]
MPKKLKQLLAFVFLFTSLINFAQQGPKLKIKITGNVIEKVSKQPLEYATITFLYPNNPKPVAGGITNAKGEFDIDVNPGIYDIKIEFISFKLNEFKQKS